MKLVLFQLACVACRTEPVDTACEPRTLFADEDGDGWGGEAVESCERPGLVETSGDREDGDSDVHPEAVEVCNGLDDDCDGLVDDADEVGDGAEWFLDGDADGFGDPTQSAWFCEAPSGYVEDGTDCDDGDPSTHPGAEEVPYDGEDQDCDGADLDDVDGDGSPWPEDCNDEDALRSPDLYEVCEDGLDNDCDDEVDTDCQYFGGVVAGDPAWTIWGTRTGTDNTCLASESCGSQAGSILLVEDVDGDSVGDLLAWSQRNEGGDLRMLMAPLGGATSFGDAEESLVTGTHSIGVRVRAGDLNDDGRLDLAVGNAYERQPVVIHLQPFGGETITIEDTTEHELQTGVSLAVGDVDGDDVADLLFSSSDYDSSGPAHGGRCMPSSGLSLQGQSCPRSGRSSGRSPARSLMRSPWGIWKPMA